MDKIKFVLICHFGLEKVLKTEIRKLGLEIDKVSDGEIKVLGRVEDIPRLNFNLRTAERVMIELANFKAVTFEELFNAVSKIELEKYIPVDGAFPITKANQDKNSVLHSSTAIQSIVKKAMVERLKKIYKTNFLSEDCGKYPFRVKVYKNEISIRLDTTGDSLHKRGYRIKSGIAPIEETLAASLVSLTEFGSKEFLKKTDNEKKDLVLIDPFCGSGTILIEAAMIYANIPPSIDRAFVSETWCNKTLGLTRKMWEDAKKEALSNVIEERKNEVRLFGFDIDQNMIRISRENAIRAGVEKMIHFECLPVKKLSEAQVLRNVKKGIILTNPPYGERLEDKQKIILIYKDLKSAYDSIGNIANKRNFELNVITSFEDAEKYIGKSNKNRKLYNGMIKTYFYTYGNF